MLLLLLCFWLISLLSRQNMAAGETQILLHVFRQQHFLLLDQFLHYHTTQAHHKIVLICNINGSQTLSSVACLLVYVCVNVSFQLTCPLGHVSYCHHFSSVIRPSTFHILIFSSETTGPIATKHWLNGPWMAHFQNCVR